MALTPADQATRFSDDTVVDMARHALIAVASLSQALRMVAPVFSGFRAREGELEEASAVIATGATIQSICALCGRGCRR